MKQLLTAVVVCTTLIVPRLAAAQTVPAIPPSITTPDKVESRLGTLDFKDGAPGKATLEKAYDHIDFTHAYETFVNTMQGVSLVAARRGFLDAGVKDNEILIFSELMDAKSLFLTANADTVYFLGFIDVSKGPMVFEVPPKVLGALDDMWFRWVIDFGLPGPDRGLGGKYLILPPGYDGAVPEGGYFVARSRTNRLVVPGPRVPREQERSEACGRVDWKLTKIYPYEAGGVGYYVTGITPAMAMRVTDIGSQYLMNTLDADKNYFDGSKTYKVTLPKGIPEANFWSLTLYDNQSRSMLDTPQRYPRAGSQSYPSPAAEKLWGRRRRSWHHRRLINRWRSLMVQVNDLSRSIVAFEHSSTLVAVIEMGARSWLVAASVPGVERQPLKKIDPDAAAVLRLIERWRGEAVEAGRTIARIVVAYEAGRDGFWLARWLIARGIEVHVIHSASVAVSRERKRAKTDRLDVAMLMRVLLGWLRGERGHCGMVAIPTLEQEDARRPSRERESLVGERSRIINRMKSALARLGIRGFKAHLRKAPERLETLRTPEGTALPPNILEEFRRDMARLALVREQIVEIEKARIERLVHAPDTGPHVDGAAARQGHRHCDRDGRHVGAGSLVAELARSPSGGALCRAHGLTR